MQVLCRIPRREHKNSVDATISEIVISHFTTKDEAKTAPHLSVKGRKSAPVYRRARLARRLGAHVLVSCRVHHGTLEEEGVLEEWPGAMHVEDQGQEHQQVSCGVLARRDAAE